MINEVKEILSKKVEDIISSPLSLTLLKCYSKLYLNGRPPKGCANSQRNYYRQLQINGIAMAEKYESSKLRTCLPAWKGLKYIPKTRKHWNSITLNDQDALILLEKGYLKETDFIKLPEKEGKSELFTQEEETLILEIAEKLKAGTGKTELRKQYKSVQQKRLTELMNEAEKYQ